MASHEGGPPDLYDVAVVGGGPAGLSATLWTARYLHTVVLIDAGDPRNWETRGIHGWLGKHGIRSPDLRGLGREDCRRFGAMLIDDTVMRVRQEEDGCFALTVTGGRTIRASRLLLAIGIRDIWPDIPGLDRCYGETAHVCPDCDGYEARGKKTIVVANGRKAVGMALALATWTEQIVICTNGEAGTFDDELLEKLRGLNVPILEARIRCALSNEGGVYALDLEEGMQLDCERIFFAIGQYPADDLGVQLGCKRDENGAIIVDERYRTSIDNVFAAGDIIPGPQLAIAAAAEGAIAAIAIHHSLLPESQRLD